MSTAAAPGDSAQVDTESRAHAGDHMALRLWLRLLACTNLVEAPLRTRLREQFQGSLPEEEFGDLLFALVNYARFEGIDPEQALERTNRKFKQRFEYIEKHAGRPLTELSLSEMDELWNEAKIVGKK